MTGEGVTGEQVTGERVTGERATGEQVTGERVTGERVTGERLTGEPSSPSGEGVLAGSSTSCFISFLRSSWSSAAPSYASLTNSDTPGLLRPSSSSSCCSSSSLAGA